MRSLLRNGLFPSNRNELCQDFFFILSPSTFSRTSFLGTWWGGLRERGTIAPSLSNLTARSRSPLCFSSKGKKSFNHCQKVLNRLSSRLSVMDFSANKLELDLLASTLREWERSLDVECGREVIRCMQIWELRLNDLGSFTILLLSPPLLSPQSDPEWSGSVKRLGPSKYEYEALSSLLDTLKWVQGRGNSSSQQVLRSKGPPRSVRKSEPQHSRLLAWHDSRN